MRAVIKFLLGLIAVAALGAFAFRIAEAPGSIAAAEEKLAANVAAAAQNSDWASVTLDGQKAVITGEAPDGEALDVLSSKITAAAGKGGLFFGGITAVDASAVTIAPQTPLVSPFVWTAERDEDGLYLSGFAPDEKTRDELLRLVSDLFPDEPLSGGIDVARGAPADFEGWREAAAAALRGLRYLQSGIAHAEDTAFSLSGVAQDEAGANAARALLSELPAGLSGEADIVLEAPPQSMEELITGAVDGDAMATELQKQENDCAATITAAVDARRIGFSSARADLDSASRAQLDSIAALLKDCPDFGLVITGHTDSSGSAARNRQLSAFRADAVRAYLISLGVDGARLTVNGAGSARPLESNRTPAGRERNRRIEIEVVSKN